MSSRGNYSRYFIILQEDEKGYSLGEGKQVTGYAKLERRNTKVKVSFFIQNLKKAMEPYYPVLICSEKQKKSIKLNKITIDDYGRGEIKFEYEQKNIAYAHISMEDIKGAAIVKMVDENIASVLCGSVGESVPDDWRTYFIEETKVRKEKSEKTEQDEKQEEDKEKSKNDKKDTQEVISKNDNKEEDQDKLDDNIDDNVDEKEYNKFDEYEKEIVNTRNKNDKEEDEEDEDEIENDDFYESTSGKFLKKIISGYEPMDDLATNMGESRLYKIYFEDMGSIDKDKEYNKYSVIYYPMMAYQQYIKKHGYYLFGYKKNKKNRIQYMVYAIPGKNIASQQPYGGTTGFVTWVPKQNRDEDEGKMGYWLMFYDFTNSCVVIPVK